MRCLHYVREDALCVSCETAKVFSGRATHRIKTKAGAFSSVGSDLQSYISY